MSQSFKEAEAGTNKFATFFKKTWAGTKTAFHAPQEDIKNIQLIPEEDFGSVFNVTNANEFFNQFNKNGSESLSVLTQWCDNIGVADDTMRAYLTDCMQKQVPASFEGYNNYVKTAIVGTKQLSFVMKALSAVGNIAFSMLASFAISKIIEGLDYAFNAADKITERAEEAKSAIDGIKQSVDGMKTTTNDIKDRYAELAQEVENLGKINQSQGTLSTDEYQEFLGLSNQLAELFPQLTKGYDDNGNAILSLSGNVNTIVGSLNNLVDVQQKLANIEILENMPDVWDGYIMDMYGEGSMFVDERMNGYDKMLEDAEEKKKDALEALSFLNDSDSFGYRSTNDDATRTGHHTTDIIQKALKDMGLDYMDYFSRDYAGSKKEVTNWDFSSLTEEQIAQLKNTLGTLASEYEKEVQLATGKIQSANAQMSGYINAWLSTEWNFSKMAPEMQNVVKDVLLNSDWISMLPDDIDASNWDEVSNWLQQNFLYAVDNIDNEQIEAALVDVFNGEFTVESLQGIVNQLKKEEGFDENNPLIIWLNTKIKGAKEFEANYDAAVNKYGAEGKAELEKAFKDNSIDTQEELDNWIEVTKGAKDAADAVAMYTESKKNANEMTVSIKSLSDAAETLSVLNDAQKELNENGKLSISTIADIEEKFSGLGDGLDGYITQLTEAYGDTAKTKQIMSEMTIALIESKYTTEELANADTKLIAAMLKEAGVANDVEGATWLINKAKVKAKAAALDLASATKDELSSLYNYAEQLGFSKDETNALIAETNALITEEYALAAQNAITSGTVNDFINSLSDEESQLGLTKDEFVNLIAKNIDFNNMQIDVSQKVEALKLLAGAALGVAGALSLVQNVSNTAGQIYAEALAEGKTPEEAKRESEAHIEWAYQEMLDSYNADFSSVSSTPFKFNYTGTDLDKPKPDTNKPDYKDPTDAHIRKIRNDGSTYYTEDGIQKDYLDELEKIDVEEDRAGEYATAYQKYDWVETRKKLYEGQATGFKNNISSYKNEMTWIDGQSDYNLSEWFDKDGEFTKAYIELYNGLDETSQKTVAQMASTYQKYFKAMVEDTEALTEAETNLQNTINDTNSMMYDDYMDIISHKEAMGEYDGNPMLEHNDLVYLRDNHELTPDQRKELDERIYSLETSSYDNYMAVVNNNKALGKYYNNEASYVNDLLWALNNLNLTPEQKKQLKEEIHNAKLASQDKEIENTKKLVDLHQGDLLTYQKLANREVAYLEHLRDTTPESDIETRMIYDGQIADIYRKSIIDAENGMVDSHINADYWRKQLNDVLSSNDLSFDIEKWFDTEGNLTAAYENDLKNINDELLEGQIQGFAENLSIQKQGWINHYNWRRDAEQRLFDHQQELAQKYLNDYERIINELLDLRIKKLNSESSLLQTHYNLLNTVAEEQHNINKELAEAVIVGARMSEAERETLFSKEEHIALSSKLNDVLTDANSLQQDYIQDLQGATAETIEEITANYERQYELKMKEYNIVKAELDLLKAEQRLENAENEKSVRVWDGNKWIYQAVLQDVLNAQTAVEDAKYALNQAKIEQAQQEVINGLDAQADALTTEKNLFAATLKTASGEMSATVGNLTLALEHVKDVDVNLFSGIISAVGDGLQNLFGIDVSRIGSKSTDSDSSLVGSSKAVKSMLEAAKGKDGTKNNIDFMQEAINALNSGDELKAGKMLEYRDAAIETYNLPYSKENLEDLKKRLGYKNGTKSATSGWKLFDEKGLGSEVIITDSGVLTQFNAGDRVFSDKMVDNLWDFANFKFKTYAPDFSALQLKREVGQTIDNRVYIGDVEVTDKNDVDRIRDVVQFLRNKY